MTTLPRPKRPRKPKLVPAVAILAPREHTPTPLRPAPRRPATPTDFAAALFSCAAIMLSTPLLIGTNFLKGWSA
ncbi:hypothetical protein [Roseixanthobacter glucoisosaccharinicivorans]|uniref:hypothetical protein n=1 Tax=Roseixanthobacter glucoisosaccharinicivorans TaxID=3119923 RepID=UPI00372B944E